MKTLRTLAITLLLACSGGVALADGPLYPVSPGSPIWVDAEGDLWFCGPSGVCLPLDTSQPPIEP